MDDSFSSSTGLIHRKYFENQINLCYLKSLELAFFYDFTSGPNDDGWNMVNSGNRGGNAKLDMKQLRIPKVLVSTLTI